MADSPRSEDDDGEKVPSFELLPANVRIEPKGEPPRKRRKVARIYAATYVEHRNTGEGLSEAIIASYGIHERDRDYVVLYRASDGTEIPRDEKELDISDDEGVEFSVKRPGMEMVW
jgi:hypothetical protein